ncbi:hypothetical protein QAD02_022554 [Eretmocerus hayati]|uniref:Uncharacterized protein n=1 Tax=Eretmocerus hayati TaxID=131215 RepID=A0ACC2PY82_9HYME|nr:hypothetical protein QAD02_022554 [Eretmocerus hayati]
MEWTNNPLKNKSIGPASEERQLKAECIVQLFAGVGMEQMFPPHPDKGYSLDLLFCSAGLLRILEGQDLLVPFCDSHHEAFLGEIVVPELCSHLNENSVQFDFRLADLTEICNILDEVDWNGVMGHESVSECVSALNVTLINVIKENVPVKKRNFILSGGRVAPYQIT